MSTTAAAPLHVELVRRFLNTLDVESSTDELAGRDTARDWLVGTGMLEPDSTVSDEELRRLRDARDGLRELVTAAHDGVPPDPARVDRLRAVTSTTPLVLDLDDTGTVQLSAHQDGTDGALGRLLAATHRAMLDGTWDRLKICRRDDCLWAFYDASRNRSGRWCSMAVCGNRTKVERFRQSARSTDAR